jgi:hypothetical protein
MPVDQGETADSRATDSTKKKKESDAAARERARRKAEARRLLDQ